MLSIAGDPEGLFGYEEGILVPGARYDKFQQENPGAHPGGGVEANYTLRGREAEREAALEMFDADGGTTAMCLAKELPDINIHVFTNGLAVAIELAQKKNLNVTMLGGQVMKENLSTASPVARSYFENTNFELAIISASAFTPENGFSCGSMVEADLLKMARQKAKAMYMMLDSSKIGKIMPHTFAHLEDIDVLITDDEFPASLKEQFQQSNIVVM